MTAQGLLVRRQGRGTFVAEAEDKSILFRFYRLTRDECPEDNQTSGFPESRYLSQEMRTARQNEQEIFSLSEGETVLSVERLRSDQSGPILWEQLVLASRDFPGLSDEVTLPNNVYHFYSDHFGIIVAKVQEKLRAVTAPVPVSQLLDLPDHVPVLEIDRRAIALDGRVVEWRRSLCRSDTMHYRNELK